MNIENSFWEKVLRVIDPLRVFYSPDLVEIIYTPLDQKIDFVYDDGSKKSKEIDLTMAAEVIRLWDSVEKQIAEVKNQRARFSVMKCANVFGHAAKISGKTVAHMSPFIKRVEGWRTDFFARKNLSVPTDPLF